MSYSDRRVSEGPARDDPELGDTLAPRVADESAGAGGPPSAGDRARRLADGLDDLTRQLRSMGERGEPGPATDLVRQAGEGAERIAVRLRRGGVDDALGELRDLGRNLPGLFMLGAFGLGLAGRRIARNLTQEPAGEGSGQVRAAGQQSSVIPPPAIGPDAGVADYPVPAGHAAYGAPGST
jgi:hypothetical protein